MKRSKTPSVAPQLNVIDLFCGCGGFSLGAARAGFHLAGAIDLDERALAAHKTNFPNTPHANLDLKSATSAEIFASLALTIDSIDGIIGGPPCQGFSAIGHKNDADDRNVLFPRFFQLVKELRPKFYICENVPGILSEKYASLRELALTRVAGEYVSLPPMKLRASDYGAPTSRERVFFFGYRKDTGLDFHTRDFLPSPSVSRTTVKDALRGLPIKIQPNWQTAEQGWRRTTQCTDGFFGERLQKRIPTGIGNTIAIQRLAEERLVSGCLGTLHSPKLLDRYAKIMPGQRDSVSKSLRLDLQGFCPTLRAGTGPDRGSYQAVRPLHPTENRVITPREAARLQGFPDWFQFDDTKWHSFRQIGNSMSPLLAEAILSNIVAKLHNSIGTPHEEKAKAV